MIRRADVHLSDVVFLGVCLGLALADAADPTETAEPYLLCGPALLGSTGRRQQVSAPQGLN